MIELGAQARPVRGGGAGAHGSTARQLRRRGNGSGRRGRPLPSADAIGLALLFAYVKQRHEAVDFLLEKDGNWNMIGVNNGTALHRAAGSGDLAMVQRLRRKRAPT